MNLRKGQLACDQKVQNHCRRIHIDFAPVLLCVATGVCGCVWVRVGSCECGCMRAHCVSMCLRVRGFARASGLEPYFGCHVAVGSGGSRHFPPCLTNIIFLEVTITVQVPNIAGHLPRQTEVGQLDILTVRTTKNQVGRLHISVHDGLRSAVQMVQRHEDLGTISWCDQNLGFRV